jgi:hypothetical protein
MLSLQVPAIPVVVLKGDRYSMSNKLVVKKDAQ